MKITFANETAASYPSSSIHKPIKLNSSCIHGSFIRSQASQFFPTLASHTAAGKQYDKMVWARYDYLFAISLIAAFIDAYGT